jgi:signal transduction histidine kinase
VPGWGIGLQFVKAVAEAHGGDVSVDSSPGRGTTFFVQLPLDYRPHIEENSIDAPAI